MSDAIEVINCSCSKIIEEIVMKRLLGILVLVSVATTASAETESQIQNNMLNVIRALKSKNDISLARIAQLEDQVNKVSVIDKDLSMSDVVRQLRVQAEEEATRLKSLEEKIVSMEEVIPTVKELVARLNKVEALMVKQDQDAGDVLRTI